MNPTYLKIGAAILGIGGIVLYTKHAANTAATNAAAAQQAQDAANQPGAVLDNSSQMLGGSLGYSASDVNPGVYGYGITPTTANTAVTGTSAGDTAIAALASAISSGNASQASTTQQALAAQLQIAQITNNSQSSNNAAQIFQSLIATPYFAGSGFATVAPTSNGGYSFAVGNSNESIAVALNNLVPNSALLASQNAYYNNQAVDSTISAANKLKAQGGNVTSIINNAVTSTANAVINK